LAGQKGRAPQEEIRDWSFCGEIALEGREKRMVVLSLERVDQKAALISAEE
jgi:hypothetical protein